MTTTKRTTDYLINDLLDMTDGMLRLGIMDRETHEKITRRHYKKIELISPGQVLLTEFMEPRNITGNRLAIDLGLSPSHVYMLIHGKRQITVETAIRLAAYFENSVQFWLNLQSAYDIEVCERTGKYAKIASLVRPSPPLAAESTL